MSLSGLDINVNTVCILKIDGKTRFVDFFFLLKDKTKRSEASLVSPVKLLATFVNRF